MNAKETIIAGKAVLGIELGSTRIKAVLIDASRNPIAQGSHAWENKLENGLWTYSIEDILSGLQDAYASLAADVRARHGVTPESYAAIGISAMMHGYMAFDRSGRLLVPFRTWRNTNTGPAAALLSDLFDFNMPLRWSLSHLCQCILDGEEHVGKIDFLTTLSGYVHCLLTGRKVLGIGDASGMMPVDPATADYDEKCVRAFDGFAAQRGISLRLRDILPQILLAGRDAGALTPEGALLLDPTGTLRPGIPLCPPEGDAGTGMVATNAVRERTGNVSAGTSSFSMIVLEKPLSKRYEKIDIVTTPDGKPVAMAHCNNCTSEINAWAGIFVDYLRAAGLETDLSEVFGTLFKAAGEGDKDCGGLVTYNYLSGEPITGFAEGRPLTVRSAEDRFTLANFMRSQLYASVGALKIGNDILFRKEGVKVDRLTAHGGLFKVPGVGQRVLAAALGSPVSVMETAGEGGAWGIALLASFLVDNPGSLSLPDFLEQEVFKGAEGTQAVPTREEIEGFEAWMEKYIKCLGVEQAAVDCLR